MSLSLRKRMGAVCLLAGVLFSSTVVSQNLPDFTGLVEQVGPAVVNIEATRTAEAAARSGQKGMDDAEIPEELRRFFGMPGMPQMPRDRTSMGTGFIISGDGYVLTNHHVIDGADEVIVRLRDRRELEATVVGSDEQSDVALLKLEAKDLPAVRLGEAKALKPGQWVLAIGSPFGFEHSVTAGIVSAVGRSSQMTGQQYVPFIQTDVPINRGNSGGPLINMDGEVVGINSQIFSNTGGYMGVSFAIPIQVAMNSADQLKDKGFVARGLLGVTIQDVARDAAAGLGLDKPGGALVNGFSPDSAAEKAGVEIGDVILKFDGVEIGRSSELPPLVGAAKPGSTVALTIFRDGRQREIDVVIGELPRDTGTLTKAGAKQGQSGPLGFAVDELSAEQRDALGLGRGEGVVIASVTGASARRANLQPGDIVLMVGRSKVGSISAFNEAVAAGAAGKPIMLLIRRGEQTSFVSVTPDGQAD
ncbi:MAG: Do family serine endopeptidase [Xanthomonadales bacterium]|nr:Do family serine endopeptidase [Xanthomonadales bacterium]